MTEEKCTIVHMPHHMQEKLCQTRPPYRQGRKLTTVKVASWNLKQVYTINDESQHLLICGVPKLKLEKEVKKLVYSYGIVKAIQLVSEYPSEEFTETYHIHYERIQSARIAKRVIDNKNFFGGLLHVFYVPELESLAETKIKLVQRRKDVTLRIKKNQQDITNPKLDEFIPKEQYHRKKKRPALPLTEQRLKHCYPGETLTSICNGIPQSIDPRPVSEPSLPPNWDNNSSAASGSILLPVPYQPSEAVIQSAVQPNRNTELNIRKRKNYKGQYINDNVKVRLVRPQLIDTRNIFKSNVEKTNIFCNVKKIESGITVKLLKKPNNEKKIIIKDPNVTHLIKPSKDLQHSIQIVKSQVRSMIQKNNS